MKGSLKRLRDYFNEPVCSLNDAIFIYVILSITSYTSSYWWLLLLPLVAVKGISFSIKKGL